MFVKLPIEKVFVPNTRTTSAFSISPTTWSSGCFANCLSILLRTSGLYAVYKDRVYPSQFARRTILNDRLSRGRSHRVACGWVCHSGSNADPLKPLLRVYKIDAKAAAKKIRAEVDTKVAVFQASLKKHKAKGRLKDA